MALSVAVAVGGVGDALVAAVSERLPKLKIAAGNEPGTDMGPLITEEHRDKVAAYVAQGAEAGATVVVDGRDQQLPTEGFFLGTTLLDDVTADMTVYRDEIFGPVLSVMRVDTFDQGLNLINANPYANGPEGLNFYTRGKVVTQRWPDPATSSVDLGFPRTR